MIGRVCLLLEALSIVICLHHLYGEKFKLDIKTVGFLAVDMIMMTAIDYYGLPSTLSIIIYLIIALYCGLEFGFEWKKIIINNILYMVIVSSIQLILMMFCYQVFNMQVYKEEGLLAINVAVFIFVICGLPRFKLDKLSRYLQDKEKIIVISLMLCVVVMILCLINYKSIKTFELYQYIISALCVITICVLVMNIGRYRMKSQEIQTELKMHKLYEASFNSLIANIRLRQHEFDNHINTIYSQHYLYHTYEELVDAQKQYCKIVIDENRYNKLLKADNQVVRGFLYGKFIDIEKFGIDINYNIELSAEDINIPVYKIIEILGNLINNAVEALEREQMKKLYVSIKAMENEFIIEVRNLSQVIDYKEMHNFFDNGFSKKGKNRGLGLYNVKKICEEYKLHIQCKNIEIEDENWLSFIIATQEMYNRYREKI